MTQDAFSFALLEKRLCAIPDGPSAYLSVPDWLVVWNVIGVFGIFIGLTPSVLIRFLSPEPWMLPMAVIGLAVEVIGFSPSFLYSTKSFIRALRHWRQENVEQLDHDLGQFRRLSIDLAEFPDDALSEHLRFAKDAQARLAAKSAFCFGSIDRLGILPVFIAVSLQLYAVHDAAAVPAWLALLGIFLAGFYMVSLYASLTRIRLQLYEMVLIDALRQGKK